MRVRRPQPVKASWKAQRRDRESAYPRAREGRTRLLRKKRFGDGRKRHAWSMCGRSRPVSGQSQSFSLLLRGEIDVCGLSEWGGRLESSQMIWDGCWLACEMRSAHLQPGWLVPKDGGTCQEHRAGRTGDSGKGQLPGPAARAVQRVSLSCALLCDLHLEILTIFIFELCLVSLVGNEDLVLAPVVPPPMMGLLPPAPQLPCT